MADLMLEDSYRRSDRVRIRFTDLVRPENRYWDGCQVQAAFTVYAWVLGLLRPLYVGRCNHIPPFLSGNPDVLDRNVYPFGKDWKLQLWLRFHYLLLYKEIDPAVLTLLEENGVVLGSERILTLPRYVRLEKWFGQICEIRMDHILDALFRLTGQTLNVSLNSRWIDAREVESISLHVRGLGVYAVQMYYRIPNDSSHWDHWICSKKGEMFYDFVLRAYRQLEEMVEPVSQE
ncbi:MAG: hypothetical protein WC451_01255 [Patescibacteria group bacterium]